MELQAAGHAQRPRDARPRGAKAWARQLLVLLKKNWLLVRRNPRSTIIQLLCPILFMIFLYLISLAITSIPTLDSETFDKVRDPKRRDFGSIPICRPAMHPDCYTFAYTPNDSPLVNQIVNSIRLANNPPIPGLNEPFGVLGFPTQTALDVYLTANQNRTQAAYIFSFNETATPRTFDWILQFNSTGQYQLGTEINTYTYIQTPMYAAASREILRVIGGNDSTIVRDVGYKNFPHPEVSPIPLISQAGSLFLLGALMFNFVSLTSQTVLEKERRLRESMTQMGLYDSTYWLSWFIIQFGWNLYTVLALIVTGAICQFNFFLHNNFGTYFLTFWLFGMTLIPLGFVITAIVRKANSAAAVGFLVFLFSFVLLILGGSVYLPTTSTGVQLIFALFSPAMFAKGLNDLDYATRRDSDPGISWSARSSYSSTWPLPSLWAGFFADFCIYLLLALYLDNVVPNEYGVRKPFYYFVLPSYWTGSYNRKARVSTQRPKARRDASNTDAKVLEEEELVWEQVADGKDQTETPLFVAGLRREYTSRKLLKGLRKKTFVAVDNLAFHIEPNQVTCLLGPNGAGKSTTISMLTGLVMPTGGDALIYGRSIRSEMNEIRHDVGVCPQFEVYWEELTGREHLELFASIKGLPHQTLHEVVDAKLKELAFGTVDIDALAVNYSGGMRRRLAVAISFIGEPPIVFLDEPTTGMDPISKREVWKVIERAKSGRAIVLTTHSMEEADILADKVAIMTRGALRVFDNPLSLKAARGSGYKLTIRTRNDEQATGRLIQWLRANAPHAAGEEPLKELHCFQGLVTFALQVPAAPAPARGASSAALPKEKEAAAPAPVSDEEAKEEKKGKKKRKAKERVITDEQLPVESIAPASAMAQFTALLEGQREALEIETMQISMGTLEEVFVRTVGGDAEQEKLEAAQKRKDKKKDKCCC